MIEYRIGNLLEQPDLTHIVHQANLYHTFGAGLAKTIKEKFPEAYQEDCKTSYGDKSKLGTISMARSSSGLYILNLYSQAGIGGKDRQTSYDALDKGLRVVENIIAIGDSLTGVVTRLGIPYKLGCGLANGSWIIVESIITDVFEKSKVNVVICQRKEDL